jgi:predicted ATPase
LRALEERIQAELTLGLHADTVGELQTLVAEYPLRERFCAQLMLALYHSGRQAEASDLYQRTRQALVDQLGMEPGPGLQLMLKQILNQDPALHVAPPPRDTASRRSNLPAPLTTFVGRDRQISTVTGLVASSRLVTLTGAGGIGKTRLATEVAGSLLDEYGDGVWLVDFAPVTDPALVAKTIMYAVGLRIQGGGVDEEILTDFLRAKHQLLLLDNCEHIIGTVAHLTAALLQTCPELRILATSREPLGVPGEMTWRVPSLSTADPSNLPPIRVLLEFEAVSLFCSCASRALGVFTLTAANATAVAGICHRLDGIPLAIELAASRLRMLSVDELQQRLNDSFTILTGGGRLVLARQQTLQATVAWSYELLNHSEQHLFGRLSVFAGGFTVPAAEAVYGADRRDSSSLDLLGRLVDKSLVVPVDTASGQARFRLLEVVRQFAHERLVKSGEAPAVQDRHADYFTAFAEDVSLRLRGPLQAAGLNQLEAEHDNIRAALAWSRAAGRADLALRLINAVWIFWFLRGHVVEGLESGIEVLSQFGGAHPARGAVLSGVSKMAWQQRAFETAERLAAEALDIFDRERDAGGRGLALMDMANVDWQNGRVAEAERTFPEALDLLRVAGDDWGASIVLNNLGTIAIEAGRYSDAERYASESLELGLRIGDPWRKGMALGTLGELYVAWGKLGRATDVMLQALILQRDARNLFSLPLDLEACATLAAAIGQPERALRLAGAAEGIRSRTASRSRPREERAIHKALEVVRGSLAPDTTDLAWREGLEMRLDEAISHALDWLHDLAGDKT